MISEGHHLHSNEQSAAVEPRDLTTPSNVINSTWAYCDRAEFGSSRALFVLSGLMLALEGRFGRT